MTALPPAGWMGDPSRGAAMGRPDHNGALQAKLHLARVRINQGGYDSGGAYWGTGQAYPNWEGYP